MARKSKHRKFKDFEGESFEAPIDIDGDEGAPLLENATPVDGSSQIDGGIVNSAYEFSAEEEYAVDHEYSPFHINANKIDARIKEKGYEHSESNNTGNVINKKPWYKKVTFGVIAGWFQSIEGRDKNNVMSDPNTPPSLTPEVNEREEIWLVRRITRPFRITADFFVSIFTERPNPPSYSDAMKLNDLPPAYETVDGLPSYEKAMERSDLDNTMPLHSVSRSDYIRHIDLYNSVDIDSNVKLNDKKAIQEGPDSSMNEVEQKQVLGVTREHKDGTLFTDL